MCSAKSAQGDGDEDELPEDELPEWKREPPKVDMSKLNTDDPENLLKATKKGRTLMMFASVSGHPTHTETEKVTQIWQGSLFNANIETQRYVVGENRVIFMLKDGAMAWEVNDFLVQQDRCEEVTIEGKSYPGKGATKDEKDSKPSWKKVTDSKITKDDKKSKKNDKTQGKKANEKTECDDGDEDELPEDELPEWKREPPKVDMSKLNTDDPENLLKATKKGRTLMMFASVSGNPTQTETEKVTQIWQGSLFNANIETQRYVVGENRVIFMPKDGAMAWEVKDFLVQQDRCEEVTIEGKSYPGKQATKDEKDSKPSWKKVTDSKITKDDKKSKKKDKTQGKKANEKMEL